MTLNKYPDIDIISYDIGVLAIMQLIVKHNIDMRMIENLLHDKAEIFKAKYGIKAYDQLEEMTHK